MDKFFRIWWPSHIAWTFYSTHFKEVKRPCNFWTNGQIAQPGLHQIMVVSLQPANLAQALFLPKGQTLQNIFYISYGDGTVASKITKFEFSKSVFYVNNLTFFLTVHPFKIAPTLLLHNKIDQWALFCRHFLMPSILRKLYFPKWCSIFNDICISTWKFDFLLKVNLF